MTIETKWHRSPGITRQSGTTLRMFKDKVEHIGDVSLAALRARDAQLGLGESSQMVA